MTDGESTLTWKESAQLHGGDLELTVEYAPLVKSIGEHRFRVELDGLELVDGSSRWTMGVETGAAVTKNLTVSSTGDGPATLTLISEHGAGSARTVIPLLAENGALRFCGDRDPPCELPPPPREDANKASMIHVNLRNDCDAPRRLTRDEAPATGRIAADAPVIVLAPGEHRVIEIPPNQWIRAVDVKGVIGSGAAFDADEDGGWMAFSCDGVKAWSVPPDAVHAAQ